MRKNVKFVPILLLMIYLVFIRELEIKWYIKLSILIVIIGINVAILYWNKNNNPKKMGWYLFFGILTTIAVSFYFIHGL